ncbi:hypothetical protein [Haloferula sp. A504]|uniref:hypothetical protein n=1 Tax=Haloferula sp. A504 TaxID=3373601 RepID=UPI0031C1E8A4|nr:hypothetical protein [Verrucomicrobiaceae bacterium E54]
MRLLSFLFVLAGLCHGADLDVEAVGRDLNGWRGGVARYSLSGTNFEVTRPVTRNDANGNLIATTVIRELKGGTPVFEGSLRMLISPDGLVRTMSMEGTVDGREFTTGETTRPEPILPASGSPDGAVDGEVDVTPVNPEKSMRESFSQALRSAVERAGSSKKLVKRDLSSWIFSSEASSGEVIAGGADPVIQAIFRQSRG